MPTPAPVGFSLGAITPEDAVSAFAARGLLRPSFRWQEVWQAEHARAFAVAGVMRLDVLQLIRTEVETAVREGTDLNTFRTAVREQLVKKGFWGNVEITDPRTGEVRTTRFDNRRLALIYDVNLRQSHAAGRWARIQRGRMPYVVYRTMRDERVRASHKPWDNLVLPKEDPWWDTHFPPNGWRCRCNAFAIDEAGLAKLEAAGRAPGGTPVKRTAPETQWVEFVNRETGQTEQVPRGIDPGFAYNPGKVHVRRAEEMLGRSLAGVGPTRPGAGDAHQVQRAVVARTRSEAGFAQFLAQPPAEDMGMPVAAVRAMRGEPPIASVSSAQLREEAASPDFPRRLPTTVAAWAMSQAVIDQGRRLDLGDGRVLWWWPRDGGLRIHVMELQRDALVWWVRVLLTLTREEAAQQYPKLQEVLR
jgi:SPP1 gp7 family putative phage head morphogenesis protein